MKSALGGSVVCLVLSFTAGSAARAITPRSPAPVDARAALRTVDARVDGTFAMTGRITTAVRVSGERRGETVARSWTLAGRACTASVCPSLVLRRQRSAGQYDTLTLNRVGVGQYDGSGSFSVGLRCRGRRYPRGERVPYRITLAVTQATVIEGISFASALSATYTNSRRIDRTICPTGPSHDAASYSGSAAPLPSPPTAGFLDAAAATGSTTVDFTDRSTSGASGAAISSWAWDFGDPGSGGTDEASTPDPQHVFTAAGNYTVCLTVTDTDGLQGQSCAAVLAGA